MNKIPQPYERILFSEKQSFNQWWLWLILIGTAIFSSYAVEKGLPAGSPLKRHLYELLANGWVIGLLAVLFLIIRLETFVKEDGIYVRFFPIQFRFRQFCWKDLSQIYVREYTPLREFGGWGIRWKNLSGREKAYNIKGNEGLQLEIKGKKKLLIGTQKSEELKQVLIGINHYLTPETN